MFTQKPDIRILQMEFTEARFEAIYEALDRLHDAASEDCIHQVSALPKSEFIGWLKEIAYTARETVRELEADRSAECQSESGS